MSIPAKWFVIGSMFLLCSHVSAMSLNRKRRQDFFFPDEFDDFKSRGQFPNQFPQESQQFFQQQQQRPQPPGRRPPSRAPFPTPVLPGPPANINTPQEASTVTPDVMLTTPSPSFLRCIGACPTTSEYNPICGTNRQLYFNQQKFDCALRCGAQVQIWRRGSCEGLFPMMRG